MLFKIKLCPRWLETINTTKSSVAIDEEQRGSGIVSPLSIYSRQTVIGFSSPPKE